MFNGDRGLVLQDQRVLEMVTQQHGWTQCPWAVHLEKGKTVTLQSVRFTTIKERE